MPAIAWLLVAVVAAVAAYLVGWPAWQSYRSRDARDLNAERYLAWRGRAVRGQAPRVREGMTGEERRRVYAGAALGAVAVVALVAFFLAS
jgi:hypothetical protein